MFNSFDPPNFSYLTDNKECLADECWCISKGGDTCGENENGPCDDDECYDTNDCVGGGYWCDNPGSISISYFMFYFTFIGLYFR